MTRHAAPRPDGAATWSSEQERRRVNRVTLAAAVIGATGGIAIAGQMVGDGITPDATAATTSTATPSGTPPRTPGPIAPIFDDLTGAWDPLATPLDDGKNPGEASRAERTTTASTPRTTTAPARTTPPPPTDGTFGDGCETPGNPVRCHPPGMPPATTPTTTAPATSSPPASTTPAVTPTPTAEPEPTTEPEPTPEPEPEPEPEPDPLEQIIDDALEPEQQA